METSKNAVSFSTQNYKASVLHRALLTAMPQLSTLHIGRTAVDMKRHFLVKESVMYDMGSRVFAEQANIAREVRRFLLSKNAIEKVNFTLNFVPVDGVMIVDFIYLTKTI